MNETTSSNDDAATPEFMRLSPVIPVAVLPGDSNAVKIAQTLAYGGIPVIEVTLRTSGAVAAIEQIATRAKEVCVGAGTVWSERQAEQAINAGARFVVSPGYSEAVHGVCRKSSIDYLPGVQTLTEAYNCARSGLSSVKLFPAAVCGGVAMVKAIHSVLPMLTICPTGGITADTAADYLAQPNVPCVGGSWLLPSNLVQDEDWIKINALAEQTVKRLAPGRQ